MEYELIYKFDELKKAYSAQLTGEIDIFNSEGLKSELLKLVNEETPNLYLDFAKLTYMDSTALGALVGVLKSVKDYNGDIYISNLKPNIAKLFKITNLDKVFVVEVNG